MDTQTKQLIAWAARMIRDQDEICRSQIPNYGTFSQEEMINLKALEKVGGGVEDPMIFQKYEEAIKALEESNERLRTFIDRIKDLAGDAY